MTASDPGTPDPSSPPRASRPGTALQRPRTSRFAIAAFVLGLAGVCPPLGFIAMTLGFVAYFRITRSDGRLSGRGYALWALGLGAASTIIWFEVWDRSGKWVLGLWETRMEAEIREVFVAAWEDDADAIRVTLGIEPGDHQAGIDLFISDVREGDLEPWSISIKGLQPIDSPFSRPLMSADIRVDATDQTIWTGVARFVLEPPTKVTFDDLDSFVAQPFLQSFKLIGPEGRVLRLPEPPSTPESSPSEADSDESETPLVPDGGE